MPKVWVPPGSIQRVEGPNEGVVPGAVRVRLMWTYTSSGTGLNVIGATAAGGTTITQALANTLGSAIKSAYTTSGLAGQMHTATTLASVGVRDLRSANMPEFIDSAGGTIGTGTGDALPRQVALVATLRTAQAGHAYRGRFYISGWAESANDASGTASSTAQNVLTLFGAAIQSAMSASGLTMAVISEGNLGWTVSYTKPAKTAWATPVTAVQVRNATWDSQRRRTTAGTAGTFMVEGNFKSFEPD